MAPGQLVTLGFEIILVSLLAVVLVYLVRVQKRIQALRNDHKQMREIIASLDVATARAQGAISGAKRVTENTERTLNLRIKQGEELSRELHSMIETGDRVADRLLRSVGDVSSSWKNQQVRSAANVQNSDSINASDEYEAVSNRIEPHQTAISPENPQVRAPIPNNPSAASDSFITKETNADSSANERVQVKISREELLSLRKLLASQNQAVNPQSTASQASNSRSESPAQKIMNGVRRKVNQVSGANNDQHDAELRKVGNS